MEYLIHLIILFSIYAILGLGLNLVVGYTGLLSIAQAAFYGIGAYVTALLLLGAGFNFFLAVVISILFCGAVAFLIGLVLSKFGGDYYALASLGFNVIMFSIFLNWQDVTRGPLGIAGIPRPGVLGFAFASNTSFLILSVAALALVYLISRSVVNSSFGRVIKAVREDERAIEVFGYKVLWYKLVSFVIGAMIAAVGGALYATYIGYIDPSTFLMNESIFIFSIVILGGLASLRGTVIGAAILILLPEVLRFVGFPDEIAAQMRQVAYGLMLILLMLYRPEGLLGEYKL